MAKQKSSLLHQKASIKFGSNLRLYSEETIRQELGAFGLSVIGFRHLMRNLCVPMLCIGKTRFVDSYSLFLALRAVLAIGESDFYAPGCHEISCHRHPSSKLDLKRFRLQQRRLCADLLYSKRLNSLQLTDSLIRTTARAAFSRIQDNAYRIALSRTLSAEQKKADSFLRTQRQSIPLEAQS